MISGHLALVSCGRMAWGWVSNVVTFRTPEQEKHMICFVSSIQPIEQPVPLARTNVTYS